MNKLPRPFYKKFMTRSQSLIGCQLWYRGEYYGLPRVCDKATYYTPLFIYRPNRAVTVYYDYNDFNQNPDFVFNYFNHHPHKFSTSVKQYIADCRRLLLLTSKQNPDDFNEIVNLYIRSWGLLTTLFSLGDEDKYQHNPKLTKYAYRLRAKTDWVSYKSAAGLLGIVKKILPVDIVDHYNFVTCEEVSGRQWPSLIEINERKQGYVFYKDKLFPDLSVERFVEQVGIELQHDEQIDGSEIVGSVACPGSIKGRVRVVFELSDLSKIKDGDVLVTTMTTPDFLPAMQKAAAFVTDEGGITCHAAIVAREIGKPCIVGTKAATEMFKDGDMVEVDADNGVVKKI